jgi:Raf kinase inhibitor-like YbhB/YbcL family protein
LVTVVLLLSSVRIGLGGGFELTSAAFEADASIPVQHTCDGHDVSPPLSWKGTPAATKGFALVCDDPDAPAGMWVHWVLYGIPGASRSLPMGVAPQPTLGDGSRQGPNDFRRPGWGGPCPPRGAPHRYVFRLWALDADLDLAPGMSAAALRKAIEGHVLAEAALTGRYARK